MFEVIPQSARVRAAMLAAALSLLAGCQIAGGGATRPRTGGDALAQLAGILSGDYDNHEQAARAAAEAKSGVVAAMRIQHKLEVVEQGHDGVDWLWRLQAPGRPDASVWLMRAQSAADGRGVHVTPYRATDPGAARQGAGTFHFDPAQWAVLEACAQDGEWQDDKFSAKGNEQACSALLPGLGEDAALLPLRWSIDAEMLHATTFADLPRGADAGEDARRVRWFSGWAAINGAGPRATSENQDWHMQRDLRLSSEGGRVALRWRDGAASGYSLELERTSYPERKLAVLQLNVIDDASGKTLTYAWTDPQAGEIGLNLGWLQLGLVREGVAGAAVHK